MTVANGVRAARIHRRIAVVSLLVAMSISAGCEGESEPLQALIVSLPMEVPAQYPSTGTVLAWVRLDGGGRIPMDVDTVNETVSGVINGVSIGDHTIQVIIEFDYSNESLGILDLATTSIPVTVDGGTTAVVFEQNDYTYANDDTDTYANVIELIAGSDPQDGASVPAPGSVPDSGRWNTMVWDQTNWR